MKPRFTFVLLLSLLPFVLSAQTGPGAGELIDVNVLASADHLQVTEFSGNIPANTGADYYRVIYTTPDIEGALDTASGLLVVPQRGDIDMAMAVYQRGTARSKQDAASNLSAFDAVFASSVLAGQGMIALSPDYLGMGEARGFHPYLDKETEASAAIDMLYAVETLLEQNGTGWNGQLFLTGFSQGGHAAMALHQELQANHQDDWPVTRSAPMSGPYDLSVAEGLFLDTDLQYPPLVLPAYIIVGQQEAEGGLFSSLEDIFAAPYASIVAQFLSPEWETGAINTDTIQNQLAAAMLPLEGGLFPARMIREEYRQAMLADEDHPLRAALRENSPLDWTPEVPIRLPYCEDDPIVFSEFILNAETIFLNLGADVAAVNGGPGIGHGDCLPPSLFTALGFFDEVRTDKGQFIPGGLIHEDSLRAYVTYVPPEYDGSEAWPVVINMHGLESNIEQQIFASRMTPVADTAQFLIVFPQALTTPLGTAWNDRLDPNFTDDVGFLNRLIDQMAIAYNIDPARVYATGLSNGGAMSHLLACQLPGRIAAVASVAGPMLDPVFEDNCNLDRPVPVLHMHGTADPVVPFEGGPVIIPGYLAPPVEDYVQFWVGQNNCEGDPAVEMVPDINTIDSSTVEVRRYNNCDQGAEVWSYRIDNGSHVWPGGPAVPPGFEFLGTTVNQDIHGSVEIWNFFNHFEHPDPAPAPQLLEKTVNVDGVERSYLLYVPVAYDGSEAWPLVISYHENSVGPDQYIPVLNTNALADTAHFLVAYPAALDGFILPINDNGPLWNDGTPVGNAGADDVAFTEQLIEQVEAEYNIDPARVYAKGVGGGGAMAAYATCQLSGRIAAMANVGGFVICQPTREVPGLFMYGTADPVIPENGIPGVLPPFVEGVKGWAVASACDTIPEETPLPDLNPADSSTVSLFNYPGCAAESEVLYYRIDGGGRTWPGGLPIPDGGPVNRDINADIEIWNFFNRHRVITDIREISPAEFQFQLYPNPASTQLTFEFELPQAARVNLTLYNPLGQPVLILADENLPAGPQRMNWERHPSVSAGLYYYCLQVGERMVSGTVVLR